MIAAHREADKQKADYKEQLSGEAHFHTTWLRQRKFFEIDRSFLPKQAEQVKVVTKGAQKEKVGMNKELAIADGRTDDANSERSWRKQQRDKDDEKVVRKAKEKNQEKLQLLLEEEKATSARAPSKQTNNFPLPFSPD